MSPNNAADVADGSNATDPFNASADQCPLRSESDQNDASQRMTSCAISDHFSLSRGLNSAHVHGTHVPVEEPFAASIADMTGTASIVERRRKLQGLALRGVVIDPE